MLRNVIPAFLLLLLPSIAVAHDGDLAADGFLSGLKHPILGPDHLLAMIAVGLWGAQLGRPLVYVLPVIFPLIMAVGGVFGLMDLPLPAVETGIALSAVVLGLAIAAAYVAPTWIAVCVVAAFAVFHGYAHGQELPEAASPLAYGIGFMISTGFLHAIGIGIGLINDWRETGPQIVRGCGAFICLCGVYFLSQTIGFAA